MIPILLLGIFIGAMAMAIALFLWGEINNKIEREKLSENCQDCKEEFGHPDNCIGCEQRE